MKMLLVTSEMHEWKSCLKIRSACMLLVLLDTNFLHRLTVLDAEKFWFVYDWG